MHGTFEIKMNNTGLLKTVGGSWLNYRNLHINFYTARSEIENLCCFEVEKNHLSFISGVILNNIQRLRRVCCRYLRKMKLKNFCQHYKSILFLSNRNKSSPCISQHFSLQIYQCIIFYGSKMFSSKSFFSLHHYWINPIDFFLSIVTNKTYNNFDKNRF